MLALWSCGRRAGVVQAQRQIHRAFAGSSAAAYALRQRVMLIRLVDWPRRGKSAGTNQMRQEGSALGSILAIQVAALPGFYFGIKPGVCCRSAQRLVVGAGVACSV